MIIYCVLIVGLLVTAVYFDLKTFHIPNRLNLLGCTVGLLYTGIVKGVDELKYSLFGMVIPVVLLFFFFIFKFIGAGDIKLLAAVGAFVQADIFKVIILTMVLTALYGVVIVMGRLIKCFRLGNWNRDTTFVHMSIPIGVATFVFLLGGG